MNNYLSQFSGFSRKENRGFGGDPILAKTEKMRVDLAKAGITGVPETSIRAAAMKNMKPFVTDERGEKYFLTPDTELNQRLMAAEKESARRGNRPVQQIAPNFSYRTASGESFKGTFLGGGSYEDFGRGGPQSSQRSWDNYAPLSVPRNPEYGSNPERIASAEAQRQIPSSSLGMTGSSPLAFTGFGSMSGLGPTPTTSMAKSPFSDRPRYGSSYGIAPKFPFAG